MKIVLENVNCPRGLGGILNELAPVLRAYSQAYSIETIVSALAAQYFAPSRVDTLRKSSWLNREEA